VAGFRFPYVAPPSASTRSPSISSLAASSPANIYVTSRVGANRGRKSHSAVSSVPGYEHVLVSHELLDTGPTTLATEAAALVPPERTSRRGRGVRVGENGTGLEPGRDAVRATEIARVDHGTESVRAVVRLGHDFVLVAERQDRQHRTEDLVPGEVAVLFDV